VNSREWHDADLEPSYATVDDWITDQLGRLEAEELAVYAIEAGSGRRPVVRILVATDVGLFDFTWERPPDPGERQVAGVHIPWGEVRGLRLAATTRLDPATLTRMQPVWSLAIDEPEVSLSESPIEPALVGFWRVCHEQMKKARAGG
jgi:hypothetical protein